MSRSTVIALLLGLVVAILVVYVGGWTIGPDIPDDVVVIEETIVDGEYRREYCGKIQNTGSTVYKELTVWLFEYDPSGKEVNVKKVSVKNVQPGQVREIRYYPELTNTAHIEQIWG